MVGGGLKMTLVFCFGPKPKFSSFDLDLDQVEQLKAAFNTDFIYVKKKRENRQFHNIWLVST